MTQWEKGALGTSLPECLSRITKSDKRWQVSGKDFNIFDINDNIFQLNPQHLQMVIWKGGEKKRTSCLLRLGENMRISLKVMFLSQKLCFDRIPYFIKEYLLVARHRSAGSVPPWIPTRYLVLCKSRGRETEPIPSSFLPLRPTLISHFWFLCLVTYILRNGGKA